MQEANQINLNQNTKSQTTNDETVPKYSSIFSKGKGR